MKSRTFIALLAAVGIAAAGIASAQNDPEHRDRGGDNGAQHNGERGAGPNHSFYKGDRLPAENHRPQDVVGDWKGRHLSEPPRGYHWVRSGDDYVLAAIATGVILQTLLSH